MSEEKQGDLKYYQNQPYDMEVDLNDEEGEENNHIHNQKNLVKKKIQMINKNRKIQIIKERPKFDLSKFEDLPASAEAKELLSIMKK